MGGNSLALRTPAVVLADQGKAPSWPAPGARFVEIAPATVKAKLKAFLQIV